MVWLIEALAIAYMHYCIAFIYLLQNTLLIFFFFTAIISNVS